MDDQLLEELKKRMPGREGQLEILYNLYGFDDEPMPDSVFVYGGNSVGKSTVVESLLKKIAIKHVVVNLIECYCDKMLFETILNGLSEHKIDPTKAQPYAKCDNMMDFLYYLKRCCFESNLKRFVIVLDKAERLRNMEPNLLPAFLKLRELSELEVSVILISEIIFEKYYSKGFVVEPLKIHFPQYNKDELLEILMLDFEHTEGVVLDDYHLQIDLDFFKNYLGVFLSVFYRACRDVSELRHLSKKHFVEYCKPVIEGECGKSDSVSLWRNISPILKASLESLYLRVSSNTKLDPMQGFELPLYAKYLLIASYLASYNPTKEDKRLFMKYHGKKQKTLRDVKAKSKPTEKLNTQLGPKPFTIERLLAIFYSIMEDKVSFNGNILVTISTLVELQVLAKMSTNAPLDGPKYRCLVNYDIVQNISKMVDFNIRKYLYDFCD